MLGEFAKYGFCGLKRKRRDFERSVLMYVSIKIPALTHSGRKSRVCVNQPDRLTRTTVWGNSSSCPMPSPPQRQQPALGLLRHKPLPPDRAPWETEVQPA